MTNYQIFNLVRASTNPYPGAFIFIKEIKSDYLIAKFQN